MKAHQKLSKHLKPSSGDSKANYRSMRLIVLEIQRRYNNTIMSVISHNSSPLKRPKHSTSISRFGFAFNNELYIDCLLMFKPLEYLINILFACVQRRNSTLMCDTHVPRQSPPQFTLPKFSIIY